MTIGWVVYAWVVGGLLSAAARGAERALRAWKRPARWVWILAGAATAGMVLAPLRTVPDGGGTGGETPAAVDGRDLAAIRVVPWRSDRLPSSGVGSDAPGSLAEALPGSPIAMDVLRRPLPREALLAWAAAVTVLLAGLGVGGIRTRRRLRRWPTATVRGFPVRLTEATGPAVMGVLRPRIVLPRHVLALDSRRLEAVLVHEDEHCRAHDLRLVALHLGLVLALPWLPWLWWQLRRLRLAVEADCDARTVARLRVLDVREYGLLLLSEAGRGGARRGRLLTAALGDPAWLLEGRIRILLGGGRHRRAALLGALATAAGLVAACEVPSPTGIAPGDGSRLAGIPTLESTTWSGAAVRMEVHSDVMTTVSEAATEVGPGEAALAVELAPDGTVRSLRVDAVSGADGMGDAAVSIMKRARFAFIDEQGPPPAGGWFPVWVALRGVAVAITLVDEGLYVREGLTEGAEGRERLRRLLATYGNLVEPGEGPGGEAMPAEREALRPRADLEDFRSLPTVTVSWGGASAGRGLDAHRSALLHRLARRRTPLAAGSWATAETRRGTAATGGRPPGANGWKVSVERRPGEGR